MARYAVVACSTCHDPWLVELRHVTASCPRCRRSVDLSRRRHLWEGDDAAQGRVAVQTLKAQEVPLPAPKLPRHDDALDAAAAQARTQRNMSRRAEAVALWLCRLEGEAPEEQLMEAMARAGIPAERAEKERIRLLSMDILFEPRAGVYSSLSA